MARNGKRKATSRTQFKYTEENYDKVFDELLKLCNNARCCHVLKKVVNETEDQQFKNLFIYDSLNFISNFYYYFKGIEDVPRKYYRGIFSEFNNNGGIVNFRDKNCNFSYYKATLYYIKGKKKFNTYLKFVEETLTAIMRQKRNECMVDGDNKRKK